MERERHIEKLLRAFAKKRKADAGAPLEMHPATRRLLQDEVARGAKKGRRKEASLWQMLFGTPRRAFAVCALMSLIISGTVFVTTMKKSSGTMEMAKNEIARKTELEPAAPAGQPAPSVIPAATPAPPMPLMAGRKDLKEKDSSEALSWSSNENGPVVVSADVPAQSTVAVLGKGQAGTAPQPASESTITRFKAPATMSGSVAENRSEGFAFSTATVSEDHGNLAYDATVSMTNSMPNFYADGTSLFQKADKAKANGQLAMQRFYRMRAVDALKDSEQKTRDLGLADKKQNTGEILDSFSVQQDGDKITVVDSDGSKYTGTVKLTALDDGSAVVAPGGAVAFGGRGGGVDDATMARRAPATVAVGANVAPISPASVQNYFFYVAGTNLSLNQLVVFSGNLVPITNLFGPNMAVMTNAAMLDVNGQQSVLQNSRIEGRAAVGKKTGIEIKATPGP